MIDNQGGIQKILWQTDLVIFGTKKDVLIPLPANADACLESIGINDFGDTTNDQWEKDFLLILHRLINENESNIEIFDAQTRKMNKKAPLNFADIPGFLSHYDHLNIRITNQNKEITLTNGHEIFWITGFSHSEIESIGYKIEKIENNELSKIY